MSRIFILFSCIGILGLSSGLFAKQVPPASSESKRSPESESTPSSMPSAGYGEILFTPFTESQPSGERHTIQAGQKMDVCIRLSKNASEYLDKMSSKAVGFSLVLEDATEPPHRLKITLGNHLKRMRSDTDSCFGGTWEVPEDVIPGIYQVADLFWVAVDQSYYSLRNYLYEFSRVEELDLQNSKLDHDPPKLIKIQSFGSEPYKMKFYPGVLRVRVEQVFEFEDPGLGIDNLDKDSLTAFYRLDIDNKTYGLKQSVCKVVPKKNHFRCVLQLNGPDMVWGLSKVTLTLDRISILDKLGNQLLLQGEEAILQQVPSARLVFEFERHRSWPYREKRDLKNDSALR